MKKIFAFLVGVFLISGFGMKAFADEGTKLVAASYSDRYHLPSCKVAQKIAPEDILVFNSPEEAAAKGYVPCKKCNPPAPKGKAAEKSNFSHASKKQANESDS